MGQPGLDAVTCDLAAGAAGNVISNSVEKQRAREPLKSVRLQSGS